MNQEELNEILKQHKLWLDTKGEEGKRADLIGADLEGVNLMDANLTNADLEGANLRYADLSGADLEGVNLRYADLSGVDLKNANLKGANLEYVNLIDANLESTGVCFFIGPKHMGIYDSKDDKLYIGCQVHSLDYWLQNYIDIGKKYKYTDEQIEKYGNWIKSLKEAPK